MGNTDRNNPMSFEEMASQESEEVVKESTEDQEPQTEDESEVESD